MTPEEQIEALEERIKRLCQEIEKGNLLIEYYRQFSPSLPDVTFPPPGYFVHQLDQGQWASGRLIDGYLEILKRSLANETDAIADTWSHYRAQWE